MTANPYAPDAAEHFNEPKSTSVLAIASLVVAILGLITFCVGGGVLGAIAALMGVIALVLIGGSNGRTGGTGLAISGIVVGLLASLLTGILAFGAVAGIQYIMGIANPIENIAARDYDAVRSSLSPDTETAATDAQIDAFAQAVEAEYGTFVALPDGLMDFVQGLGNLQPETGSTPYGSEGVIPMPVDHDQGVALYWLVLDQDNASASGKPLIRNIGVELADDTFWLGPVPGGTQVTPAPELPGQVLDEDPEEADDGSEDGTGGDEPPAGDG